MMVGFGTWKGLGNNAADPAADFGRRGVDHVVIDARRNLSGVSGRWYPVILELHRSFFAISRTAVNHDGGEGTAPDSIAGALPKRRTLVLAVRNHAWFPGPAFMWTSGWISLPPRAIAAGDVCFWPYSFLLLSAEDVGAWPYSVGMLAKWVAFLGTLHWPASRADLGVSGVSHVELLILYELWLVSGLTLRREGFS